MKLLMNVKRTESFLLHLLWSGSSDTDVYLQVDVLGLLIILGSCSVTFRFTLGHWLPISPITSHHHVQRLFQQVATKPRRISQVLRMGLGW